LNEIKKLTKSTIIYFLGTVGTKAVSFLLLPIYTSFIAPDAYGTYDLNITYATLFSSFFFLDIWCGIMKFIFERKTENEKRQVMYNGIIIFVTSALIYTFSMWLFGISNNVRYLPWVILYGLSLCVQNLYGYLARTFGFNVRFAVSGIVATTCTALLNIILLVVVGMDYRALYISFIIGVLVQCIILEFKLKIIVSYKCVYFNIQDLKELLYFSLPLCVNSLCYWLLTGYNRVFITRTLDTQANGYYAIASKFGGILIIVSSCFTMAWQELAYGKGERSIENGRFYSKATDIYMVFLLCGFTILIPVIYFAFPYLIASEYSDAKVLIPINMLATLASILYTFLGNIISTYKRNNIMFLSTLAACIVNFLCVHLLVGKYGVEAANIALLLGYCVSNIMRIWTIKKIVPYHLKWWWYLCLLPLVMGTTWAYWQDKDLLNVICILVGIICGWMFIGKELKKKI